MSIRLVFPDVTFDGSDYVGGSFLVTANGLSPDPDSCPEEHCLVLARPTPTRFLCLTDKGTVITVKAHPPGNLQYPVGWILS